MSMPRRILLPLLALALALVPGCQTPESTDGALRVGVTLYRGDDAYLSNMTAALQELAAAHTEGGGERVNVSVSDAGESQATQNGQIDRFLSLGYDVLLVNMVDRTDAARVVDKAQAAGVPVIFFNREPVGEDLMSWDKAFYVGSDARQSAVLQAGIVLDLWQRDRTALDKNGDGVLQYIMLEGEIRHQDTILRTDVPIQELRQAGVAVERLGGGVANWDRDQAAALTETCLEAYGDGVEVIFCNNDDMALGAADAVEVLGLDFSNIVGIDGTPQGLAAVDEGRLLGTVVMDYPAHAQAMLDLALALAGGEDPYQAVTIGPDRSVRVPMYTYVAELGP